MKHLKSATFIHLLNRNLFQLTSTERRAHCGQVASLSQRGEGCTAMVHLESPINCERKSDYLEETNRDAGKR